MTTTLKTASTRRRLMAASILAPLVLSSALAFAQTPAAPAAPAAPSASPAAASQTTLPAPAAPRTEAVTVNQLRDMSAIRLEGRVAEIFGERFVLEDATGRTLVTTGPEAREGLVKVGDTVSVEGRFGRGEVRASALTTADGERVALRGPEGLGRDGPGRDGPRGPGFERGGPDGERGPGRHHGPRPGDERGPGPKGERAEARGGWFSGGIDEDAAAKALTDAGYADVQLVDTLKHHAEFTAKDAAGATWRVKVSEDNAVAEREPYRAPMTEEAAKAAIERLGYTYVGEFETRKDHVEADATDGAGKSVRVELNADGSLRKERFDS